MWLRSWLIRTVLILAVLTCLPSMQVIAGESRSASVAAVRSIGFTVSDMDRSIEFYRDVLTFKPVSDVEVDGPEYD